MWFALTVLLVWMRVHVLTYRPLRAPCHRFSHSVRVKRARYAPTGASAKAARKGSKDAEQRKRVLWGELCLHAVVRAREVHIRSALSC